MIMIFARFLFHGIPAPSVFWDADRRTAEAYRPPLNYVFCVNDKALWNWRGFSVLTPGNDPQNGEIGVT